MAVADTSQIDWSNPHNWVNPQDVEWPEVDYDEYGDVRRAGW